MLKVFVPGNTKSMSSLTLFAKNVNTYLESTSDVHCSDKFTIPCEIGIGQLYQTSLDPGLSFLTMECVYNVSVSFRRVPTARKEYYIIYYDLSEEETTCHFGNIGVTGSVYTTTLGKRLLKAVTFFSSDIPLTTVPTVGGKCITLQILISRNWLLKHIEIAYGKKGELIKQLLGEETVFFEGSTSLEELSVIHEIINHPFPNYLKMLAFKSRILSLISSIIERMMSRQHLVEENIESSDIHRIIAAKNILASSLEERPPSVFELARQSAMGITKFKSLFKKIHGVTCYQYHLQVRMDAARRFLGSGQFAIAEVGYKVGYENAAHFTRAFKKFFGFLPSEVKNSPRKNFVDVM